MFVLKQNLARYICAKEAVVVCIDLLLHVPTFDAPLQKYTCLSACKQSLQIDTMMQKTNHIPWTNICSFFTHLIFLFPLQNQRSKVLKSPFLSLDAGSH